MFCGAGGSTLMFAEQAVEVVQKMITASSMTSTRNNHGSINNNQRHLGKSLDETSLTSTGDSIEMNRNSSFGTDEANASFTSGTGSQLDLSISSFDAFAKKLKASGGDGPSNNNSNNNSGSGCYNWAWGKCDRRCSLDDMVQLKAFEPVAMDFLRPQESTKSNSGKENSHPAYQNRRVSKTSGRAAMFNPKNNATQTNQMQQLKARAKQQQRSAVASSGIKSKDGTVVYPSEIIVYKPKPKWHGKNGSVPKMSQIKIAWSVDRNLENGMVDKWTGSLLKEGTGTEIGWITLYSINQQIARKPAMDDPVLSSFLEEFILPLNNPLGEGGEDSSRTHKHSPASATHTSYTSSTRRTSVPSPYTSTSTSTGSSDMRLSDQGGGVMTLAQMIAIGPIYLVTDITLHPNYRGMGFGLFLLDTACRRVAQSFSLVVVSLREAVDDTLKVYYSLLGFQSLDNTRPPAAGIYSSVYNSDNSSGGSGSTPTIRGEFMGRRNGQQCPCVEEICPYFPTPAAISVNPNTNSPKKKKKS